MVKWPPKRFVNCSKVLHPLSVAKSYAIDMQVVNCHWRRLGKGSLRIVSKYNLKIVIISSLELLWIVISEDGVNRGLCISQQRMMKLDT